jgi:crossover junction endodeoxyribonuclease RusA
MGSMPVITIDLPYPVSMNRIWRGSGKHVYRSPEYINWLTQAGFAWMTQKSKSKTKRIEGEYEFHATVYPPDKRKRDLGNLEKVLQDFAQQAGIIEDDHFCRKITLEYGGPEDAPLGARLTFTKL